MQLIITIDTEEDNQWAQGSKDTLLNLEELPRFQSLSMRYGFTPTYLCTYGVASSKFFQETIRRWQESSDAEIGAHLHPWANPPFNPEWDNTSGGKPYPSELPLELFKKKLVVLTDLIEAKTGQRPRSYRAGRWGFCAEHIAVLEELGYNVDSSVTPFISWKNDSGKTQGGPDFRLAEPQPYRLNRQDPCRAGDSTITEVPSTIVFTNTLLQKNSVLRKIYLDCNRRSWIRRIGARIGLEPQWLRPFPKMTGNDLIEVLKTAKSMGLSTANLMFHSSELLMGSSPYSIHETCVVSLFSKLELLFDWAVKNGYQGKTLNAFFENGNLIPLQGR